MLTHIAFIHQQIRTWLNFHFLSFGGELQVFPAIHSENKNLFSVNVFSFNQKYFCANFIYISYFFSAYVAKFNLSINKFTVLSVGKSII